MGDGLSSFLYGAVGGGLVATLLRVFEQYWVAPWLTSSAEAKHKLVLYGRPLYLGCHQLEFRLTHIGLQQQQERSNGIESLKCSLSEARSLEWFTKNGYYLTSSAYVIACVAAWISLYQRDVVFLPFRHKSLAAQFFNLIERFKITVSTKTILWYHYIDGIGELLVETGHDRPMPFSRFSEKLFTDLPFRQYYDQLFQFLQQVGAGEYREHIGQTVIAVRDIKRFLADNDVVPVIEAYDHLPSDSKAAG